MYTGASFLMSGAPRKGTLYGHRSDTGASSPSSVIFFKNFVILDPFWGPRGGKKAILVSHPARVCGQGGVRKRLWSLQISDTRFDTPCNPSAARRGRRIRMRLAARAPPPPILELGACCSWLHSAACKFAVGDLMAAFLLAFNFCIFLQISVCS